MTSENQVALVRSTPEAEQLIAYCARVSSPQNQSNTSIEKLLTYCINHGHWSIFEMANMVLEINTTRAIAPQILRHKSFSFQEFSQRYAEASGYVVSEAREQDLKNRQNSTDTLSQDTKDWWEQAQIRLAQVSGSIYKEALSRGMAKECARAILPLNTGTRLYMNGTLRSWIHYIQVRTDPSTQKEHRDIALEARDIFAAQFPVIAKALQWPLNNT